MRAIDADRLLKMMSHWKPYMDMDKVRKAVQNMPTLTPPNEPLPVIVNDEPDREYIDYICPRCKNTISQRRRGQRMETVYQCKYHDNCGQRVDWSNPQPDLRPVSREQVEKVWRAHWNESVHLGGFVYCSRCGYNALEANNYTFCPKCGSPFTDEAVEMVMERLEALHGEKESD